MIKEKLMKALKVAAANYNGGMGANAAVAKAAEDADFNEKQAERLTEMFNTLATLNKEKDASDPTGSCELASKAAVSKLLLGGCTAEKAAAAPDFSDEYAFYAKDPTRTNPAMEARSSGRRALMKAASAETERIPDELNVSQRSLYRIIEGKIANLKTAADAADDVARNLRIEADRAAVKIAKAIESPFADARLADLFKAACGSAKAVGMVSEYSTKVAESDGGQYARMSVFDAAPVDDLLKAAEAMDSGLGMVAEYERKRDFYRAKAAEAETEMREAVGIKSASANDKKLSDFFHGVRRTEETAADEEAEVRTDAGLCMKIAELIRETGVSADEVARLAEDFDKEAAPKMLWNVSAPSIADAHGALVKQPGVDAERKRLLNVRRSIILADLMANDPIIRDADPNVVTEAYKTIVMTSPRVSLDKAQVRAFLRSSVNSVAISPSDAKIIADVDKGISLSNVDRLMARDSSIKDSNL